MLPGGLLATVEFIYGKDINSIYVRNADLGLPLRTLYDGRPFFGGDSTNGNGAHELNPTAEQSNFGKNSILVFVPVLLIHIWKQRVYSNQLR
jgi:hypothetical protein